MSDKLKQWGPVVATATMAIGIVANLILLIIFFVSDHQMIQRHEGIIQAYEKHGTPSVVTIKSTYDERLRATDSRIEKLESAVSGIADMRLDIRSINVTLAVLSKTLDAHTATTGRP